jgi:bifunctional non-homologous end joining protein LigD
MRWLSRTIVTPAPGFIQPCIPTKVLRPPSGNYVWEIKLDGYRLLVRKAAGKIRIYSRRGADFTNRFPRIVEAVRRMKVTSVLLDGEGIVYDAKGMPNFGLLRSKQYDNEVALVAFDLLELDGEDVRKQSLLDRKKRLAKVVATTNDSIEFAEYLEGNGADIFRAACELGHEGIVAKRKDLPYESGKSWRWLKIKNPESAAAKRVEEGSL